MWEYRSIVCNSISEMMNDLHVSGSEGWELVQVLETGPRPVLIFKRPLKG